MDKLASAVNANVLMVTKNVAIHVFQIMNVAVDVQMVPV